MAVLRFVRPVLALVTVTLVLVACSGDGERAAQQPEEDRETIWDLFEDRGDPSITVQVNRYIWNAAFEVLDFLPVESADPFSGIIVTGWGKAPGSDTEYRAAIIVKDPALAARSLRVSLMTRDGPADQATVDAVENAIFARARQLRHADERL